VAGFSPAAPWRRGVIVNRLIDVSRLMDIAVAGVLLLVFLPLLVVVAAAIRLDSPGPIFFRCRRVGFRGAELQMLKFRKMRDGAPGAAVTLSTDDRFTTVGRVLAKTKLDELPQLWNVLKGEMTLVGPRPEDPQFVALHSEDYASILTVKPGMTGFCQLAFAKEGDIFDPEDRIRDYVERLLPQKVALDLLYVDRRSLLLDLGILAWTGIAVLARRDVAVNRSAGTLGVRRRPRVEEPVAVPIGFEL
jgi:lipopolysaccharide/colanic/teichoic acid biosynthesis glycosyltransferase